MYIYTYIYIEHISHIELHHTTSHCITIRYIALHAHIQCMFMLYVSENSLLHPTNIET